MADLYSQLGLGEALIDGQVLSFEANAAITKGQAVKLVAVANDLPKVDVAGATDKAIGIASKTVSAGEQCSFYGIGAIVKVTAGGAITAGNAVKAGASGKVVAAVRAIPSGATTVTSNAAQPNIDAGYAFGTALQSPTADGDTFLMQVGGMP